MIKAMSPQKIIGCLKRLLGASEDQDQALGIMIESFKKEQLSEFARRTLSILHYSSEWDVNALDAIADAAYELGIADPEGDGEFISLIPSSLDEEDGGRDD
tara:strand:+ start:786 stop:1088 length:303 start_codon:yes stop_codon:yes gene_type:complete